MNNKLYLFVLVFVLGLMSVNAYDYNPYSSYNFLWCYQESFNVSNQSGIDGNCGLNYNGVSYINGFNSSGWDGNWTTLTNFTTSSYALLNYSFPSNLEINKMMFSFKYTGGIGNFTLPNVCVNNSVRILQINMTVTPIRDLYFYCKNYSNNGWYLIYGSGASVAGFSEEAVYWNLSYRNVTYSLTAPDGVFGETSSIVLNLSKGSNQSYSNGVLVYNGTTYSSPTQTDYTDYTLFTQSISNSALGNFSYFWNVSLSDYGTEFNFSTENGSHVVGGLSLNLSYFDTGLVSMSGKNVSLSLIGAVSNNYSTVVGGINISNLSSGSYTLVSSSDGYVQNNYVFSIDSDLVDNPLTIYLQPENVTYYGLITVKNKYSKDIISNAKVTVQRFVNNAWVTEQLYDTDFNGQCQGYFVIDTVYYNFLVSIDGVTYFGVINSNVNKKVIYANDITNGIVIEIDLVTSNPVYEFYTADSVGVGLNFTNTSNSTGYFTFRWSTSDGSQVNGSLIVYKGDGVNCTNSAITSSGTISCYVNATSTTMFQGVGYISGYNKVGLWAVLWLNDELIFDWGVLGWFISLMLVIIGYFAFSSIPSMSLLVGTGLFGLLSVLNLIFKGINPLLFVGFLAVAFIIAKIPSRSGFNG